MRTLGILFSGLGLAMLLLVNGLDRFRLEARVLKIDNPPSASHFAGRCRG